MYQILLLCKVTYNHIFCNITSKNYLYMFYICDNQTGDKDH